MTDTTITLSSSPTTALFPGAALVTGADRDTDGNLVVWLGHRASGVHTHCDGEIADQTEAAWRATFSTHLWARGIPREVLCTCNPDLQPREDRP